MKKQIAILSALCLMQDWKNFGGDNFNYQGNGNNNRSMEDIINGLKSGSLDWKNFGYNANLSALGYNADVLNFMNYMGIGGGGNISGKSALNFNADSLNYGGVSDMTPQQLRQYLNSSVASGAMTTLKLRAFWTAGAGLSPAPVDVTFFASTFQAGTFNADGDLEFTNSNGDTATITCLTSQNGVNVTMEQIYDLLGSEPFQVAFIRMRPKTQAQLDYAIDILSASQFGSQKTNSINPDDWVDPDQYQLLRVDIPMNVSASKKQGWKWTIDEDQTGSGVSMTLFIPSTVDNTKLLAGQSQVRNLNNGNDPTFWNPAQATNNTIQSLATNPIVKSIMSSGVAPAMGKQMVLEVAKTVDLTNTGLNRPLGGNGGGVNTGGFGV